MNRVLIPTDLSGLETASPRGGRVEVLRGSSMGTTWSVKMAVPPNVSLPSVRHAIERALGLVVAQMSTWEPASDLCRFNRAPAGSWRSLPDECFTVLSAALDLAAATGGAYDPTVGPLVDLWGFGPPGPVDTRPPAGAVAAARARTGWARVALDPGRRRALQPGGVALDLSSIAKGFAVDRVAGVLSELGVTCHLVEIGGELRGRGTKPDGAPWWVAIEHPPTVAGARAAPSDLLIALHALSVATSADSPRGFATGGRWHSHTIDPRTGHPVAHGLASVTVLHPACMTADALATALMVLGVEAGLACANRLGVAARFVERRPHGLVEHLTPGAAALLA